MFQGGGMKIRLLREGLDGLVKREQLDDETVIVFVDAYDVIVNGDHDEIARRFAIAAPNAYGGARIDILFGAESFCWPDAALANEYPVVVFGDRFLNSGAFAARFDVLRALLAAHTLDVVDTDDDQLVYSRLFVDTTIRTKFGMAVDSLSLIFQNLNGAQDKVRLELGDDDPEVSAVFESTTLVMAT